MLFQGFKLFIVFFGAIDKSNYFETFVENFSKSVILREEMILKVLLTSSISFNNTKPL